MNDKLKSALKIGLATIIGAATGYFWPGNPVEKAAEAYIESETGVNVDLTLPVLK